MAAAKTNDNLLGAVAYLLGFITGIVLLLVEKKSKFIRFHAMQSTIVSGLLFVLQTVLGIFPLMGLFGLLQMLVGFAGLILWIVMMVKAYQGETYKLPVIGDLAEQQLAKM